MGKDGKTASVQDPAPFGDYTNLHGGEEETTQYVKNNDPLVRETDPHISNGSTPVDLPEGTRYQPWIPGILTRFPWLGVLSLGLVWLCMAAACAIIVLSNGERTDTWSFQPTVLLALASAAANALLAVGFARGVEIAWWRTALQGASMDDLHHRWLFASSVWSALASVRRLNHVTIASAFAGLAIIDGPLLQRAIYIVPRNYTTERQLVVQMSDIIPPGYTGVGGKYSLRVDYFTPEFSRVVSAYSAHEPIDVSHWGCNGTCTGHVSGAGLVPICEKKTEDRKFSPATKLGSENEIELLHIAFTWGANFDTPDKFFNDGHVRLDTSSMDVKFSPEIGPCDATYFKTTCRLQPAVVEYSFRIDNGVLSLQDDKPEDLPVYSLTDINVDPNNEFLDYPGIAVSANGMFRSRVRTVSNRLSGKLGFSFSGSTAYNYFRSKEFNSSTYCFFTFDDPADDMKRNIHELMFRTALAAVSAPGNEKNRAKMNKTIVVEQTNKELVFQARYEYLGGALVVMLAALLAVSMTYYGWWQLGRKMSMSPIEMARVFNAPLLKGAPSNAKIRDLLAEVGKTRVRYGEMLKRDVGSARESNGGDSRGDVGASYMGARMDVDEQGQAEGQLGFDKAASIRPPENGKFYC
ncbi:hypothetical protein FQN50_008000 [Emmonsiellopsis sp. PD_5]|nr:hypothetical protein FQN50_008000 [Emmonsiellopsis sp. PD_5]